MRLSELVPKKKRIWLPYPKDPAGTFEVLMNHISVSRLDDLRRRCRPSNAMESTEISLRQWNKVVSTEAIAGWRGLKDDNDNDVEYSPKLAEQMLNNMDFSNWVTETCTEVEKFLGEDGAVASSD